MKARRERPMSEQRDYSARAKTDGVQNGPSSVQRSQVQLNAGQAASAQAIRKRRSSINVYDQPSSLNSRLRQLETDMLRLDEDRTKLFDDTHAALAQYELKINEIHAILKSRQDNVEKYVEDMKTLLQAKEEFERQAKSLNEKHDRIHEKFMHRETTISREIKLLKNKFELLEKSRQFRSILQKSTGLNETGDSSSMTAAVLPSDESLTGNLGEPSDDVTGEPTLAPTPAGGPTDQRQAGERGPKSVRLKLSKLQSLGELLAPLWRGALGRRRPRNKSRRRTNRVASVYQGASDEAEGAGDMSQIFEPAARKASGRGKSPGSFLGALLGAR